MNATQKIWDLDEKNIDDSKKFCAKHGFNEGTHKKFKVGQVIEFWTGYNNDIRVKASIKGINGVDLYVYNDAYWFPIQDDSTRKIKAVQL